MEDLEKKYNIIIVDEDFIGYAKNLKEYFIATLAYNLQQNDLDIEDKIVCIENISNILNQINKMCYDNTVIRVCYNPMGNYFISINGLER